MMIWRQFVMEWRLYSRDRVAMFWTFAFPVVLLLGFGTIFRDGGGPKLSVVRVQSPVPTPRDEALDQALKDLHLQVQSLPKAEAEARWSRGETAAQLEPDGAGYRLRLNSYLMAQAGATAGLANQAWLVAQARLSGAPEPQRIPVQVESPGHKRSTNYASFLLPGLLGLNLVSMGLFSVGMVNVSYREKGKFRRLAVTPLPKWIFLLGQVLHRLTVTVVQAAILLLVGRVVFGIQNQGSFLDLLLVMTLGTGCFMAFGFALSGFAETSEGYAAISNLVFFPLMMLSGVYFTLDSAPAWLQHLVAGMPLAPFIRALRAVFNDGAGLAGHGVGLVIVLAWGLAAFVLAVRRFRWA
ncbi:MAG: ABC transporter permease [Geothrix sp.]|uniref:ABC transporter permease n=1 Tax=Geothrix sp. TaxID=1962974 RepID=UPI0017C152FE|nr:ABC transporter permease [Geothrix sp.]NWJ39989.1 ABC transporter permease [Geothrix sp.]WIL22001.1 MAG: ABC transporter permease [Geothrix sp.]